VLRGGWKHSMMQRPCKVLNLLQATVAGQSGRMQALLSLSFMRSTRVSSAIRYRQAAATHESAVNDPFPAIACRSVSVCALKVGVPPALSPPALRSPSGTSCS